MNVIADTNLILRAAIRDDPAQHAAAVQMLRTATTVSVPTQALCEFVWVLARSYKRSQAEIIRALQRLLAAEKVRVDREAVAAGLAFLEAGADFADGVIAHEGQTMGGEVFVSFDARAVKAAASAGFAARSP